MAFTPQGGIETLATICIFGQPPRPHVDDAIPVYTKKDMKNQYEFEQ